MIWLNGKALELSQLDRGLLYGDGFFTTILLVQGQISNWHAHWQRLETSAKRLGFSQLSESILLTNLKEAIIGRQEILERSVAKIIVTRGEGGRGYQPPEHPTPNIYIQLLPYPDTTNADWIESELNGSWPIFVQQVTWSRINCASTPSLAGIKHLNRLENVLAQQQLQPLRFSEAVMQDIEGGCISGTQAGLALVQGDSIVFADTSCSGVKSTGLELLQSAGHGYAMETNKITRQQLLAADEIFLCNAIRGVMPVVSLDEKHFPIQQTSCLAKLWVNALQKSLL